MSLMEHDGIIIAVDFDGTLSNGTWDKDPSKCTYNMNEDLIEELQIFRSAFPHSAKIILWTCRGGEYLKQAVLKCKEYGLTFDAINTDAPEVYEWFDEYTSPKIYADLYVDDKAIIDDEEKNWDGKKPNYFSRLVHKFTIKCLLEEKKKRESGETNE